ncbi:MAG: tRNA (N6-isopentenyl adenosine(37)-C2)-methylthiotransferase MiaB [Chloroflexi bacterium RBG_16_58_14]|nr:MAG: tRNA (N6-isopentenyl adenosine(37)-C2)-methylthiotransferase MiaB [Chloroflexi bacterium RBG_16_58_14]
MKYHIWTEGCQMNVADSQRVASALERIGYEATRQAEEANVIVLNTCVVRQSAEDKAYGRLHSLRPLKEQRPDLVINLMGCMVGVKGHEHLRKRFPFVDVFSPPSDPAPLVEFLTHGDSRALELDETRQRFALMDEEVELPELLSLPDAERGRLVSAHVPVVLGCSHACTFCIIPYRRGVERSRPVGAVIAEVRRLVEQGVREVTFLGQIVDRYGKDVPDGPNLAALLRLAQQVEGLERIRFLTSHPNWMNDDLLDTVAELPKVMPHIEVPVQAGDDQVLENMRRGYTAEDYRRLVEKIRQRLGDGFPGVSIATDIIVGFPGETEAQFQNTYDLLEELKLDVAHLARYSTRPGTVATRRMVDDVPEAEKMHRFRLLEAQQERLATGINARYLGETVEVLFEEKVKERWKGRTATNKLVFVESRQDLQGLVRAVNITWSGPWSMIGSLPGERFLVT